MVGVTALFLLFVLSLCPTEPQNMCAWVEACFSEKGGKMAVCHPRIKLFFVVVAVTYSRICDL